jgi:D-beta-D-heptose 7-phosphate kinase/D-beta-D-heptose 1-phosphate adenosyltransferase
MPNILVIGDLMIDEYLWGSCEKISPEAPVQVVEIDYKSVVLGGAGNVINNLKALGANVDIISVIGECQASKELTKLLTEINVDTQRLVIEKNRISSKKTRIISSNQQIVRYDQETIDDINSSSQKSILKSFKSIVKSYDIILISDYGKGVMTSEITQSIIGISKDNNLKVLVDPKGQNFAKYKGAYLLTPNKKEASEATNIEINDDLSLNKAIKDLKTKCNLTVSIITLSEKGVAIFDSKTRIHPTVAKEVFDVTGAGDTILASLGFALASDKKIDEAVKFANLASGVVVGKIGSATASLNEIIEYESSINKSNSYGHIKTVNEISIICQELKNKNKKIIFTNGCFDILHVGHIKYLEKAKSFGDVLILGLNSDNSTRLLKGEDRPINNQDDRAYILASLEVVDYLVIFEEETPFDLINLIKPDILVKGGDYKGKEVIGKDIVNDLKIVDFIPGKSTSATIKRIRKE